MARRATVKVKSVRFFRIYGETIETRMDQDYRTAIQNPTLHAVEPDLLRYELAFQHPDDPTLVAFVVFSNGYSSGQCQGSPTRAKWRSHGYQYREIKPDATVKEDQQATSLGGLDELWNSADHHSKVCNFSAGGDWYTFRHPNVPSGMPSPDYHHLVRVPLKAFLALTKDQNPQAANPACPNRCGDASKVGYRTLTESEQSSYSLGVDRAWHCPQCGNVWAGEEARG